MLAGLMLIVNDDFSGLAESIVNAPPNSSNRPWTQDKPMWEILKLIPACCASTAYSSALVDVANPIPVTRVTSAILRQARCIMDPAPNSESQSRVAFRTHVGTVSNRNSNARAHWRERCPSQARRENPQRQTAASEGL